MKSPINYNIDISEAIKKYYISFSKNDDVCYFNPDMEHQVLEQNNREEWNSLYSRLDTMISLLEKIQTAMGGPSPDVMTKLCEMLEESSEPSQGKSDVDECGNSLVSDLRGIPDGDVASQLMKLVEQFHSLGINISPLSINIVQNGDIVGFKANESYGDNYSMMPGSKVE